MSLNSVTPDSDASNVTPQPSVTRNGAPPLSNAERQARYRARRKAQHTTEAPEQPKPRSGAYKGPKRTSKTDKPKRPCPPTPVAEKPHIDPDRPSLYSEVVAEEICLRLSHGETLVKICRDHNLPSRTTVLRWVNEDHAGFANRFARARDLQFEHWADDLIETGDAAIGKPELANGLRLACDNRKWLLARLKPSLYSERFEARVANPDGSPLQQVDVASAVEALLAALPALAPAALPGPLVLDAEVVPVEPTPLDEERS